MQDIFEHMQKIIAEQFAVDPDEITMDTSFEEDLGADSVDLVELVMSMEEEFEIGEVREEELATLSTVGDCVNFLTKKLDYITFIPLQMYIAGHYIFITEQGG